MGKVLEHLIEGDEARAVEALGCARKQNSHTEKFLVGKGKFPKMPLDSYTLGDISEAQMYAIPLEYAGSKHPKALGWLLMQGKLKATKDRRKPLVASSAD